MQDKQKVTLYLPPDLHRKLKIRGAVDSEPMSAIAERAIDFYLDHPDVVEEVEAAVHGSTHRVYTCPECTSPLVMRSGEMAALKEQPGVIGEQELAVQTVGSESLEERVPASV